MLSQEKVSRLQKIASQVRINLLEMIVPHTSHHIGCALSIVELLTWLYFSVLKINPKNPKDKNRDIFILSKGHAASALYAVLYQKGFFSKKLLLSYDRNGSTLAEHAAVAVAGVEVSTGSLGHGLPVGVGFALAFKNEGRKNKVFVLLSDGELNEGSNWEAFMFAAQHKLNNLYVLLDKNGFQGYGRTSQVINLSPLSAKFTAFNWRVLVTDGHDFGKLSEIGQLLKEKPADKPTCIIAKTIKGKGVKVFEAAPFESHYRSLDEKTKQLMLTELRQAAKKL